MLILNVIVKSLNALIKMTKFIFILAAVLMLLCNINVQSQSDGLIELSQKAMADAADWLYDNFEDFDRECFLTGTMDDDMGHYQTFTANQSIDEVSDKVKGMFEKDYKFIPDTMICRRITAYRDGAYNIFLALFVATLFNNDYPDLRVLRVCSPCPPMRHYGSEIRSASIIPRDSVCREDYTFELFSSSLAKTIAGYYKFDYDQASIVSSGGDIGYRGIINRERISTDAQKMSFLAGVLFRYGFSKDADGNYSVIIPNSLSTARACADILKEFGCTKVKKNPRKHKIVFKASDKIENRTYLLRNLFNKLHAGIVAF
jgi:hypothetical protein